LEEIRSHNSRSTGSRGPKSEGKSITPGSGCIGGSGSVSEKTVKGSAQLGDETMTPELHFVQPADAKKLILIIDTEERDGHKVTEEEQNVWGGEETGQLIEKESLTAEQRVESNKDDCTYEDRNDIMRITETSTAQFGDTFAKVQEMEIGDFGLTVEHNQSKK
jgi:hypothetical protein